MLRANDAVEVFTEVTGDDKPVKEGVDGVIV
jgi:hypothetical protein